MIPWHESNFPDDCLTQSLQENDDYGLNMFLDIVSWIYVEVITRNLAGSIMGLLISYALTRKDKPTFTKWCRMESASQSGVSGSRNGSTAALDNVTQPSTYTLKINCLNWNKKAKQLSSPLRKQSHCIVWNNGNVSSETMTNARNF